MCWLLYPYWKLQTSSVYVYGGSRLIGYMLSVLQVVTLSTKHLKKMPINALCWDQLSYYNLYHLYLYVYPKYVYIKTEYRTNAHQVSTVPKLIYY